MTELTADPSNYNTTTVGHDNLSQPQLSSGAVTPAFADSDGQPPAAVSTSTTEFASAEMQKPTTSSSSTPRQEWPANYSSYDLLTKIGQGAFASVWRARVSTDHATPNAPPRMCAIKILNLEHVDTNFVDIRLEVQTMRLSSHPNVLACHTSFIQDTNLWLVTQLMNKGSSLHCIQGAKAKWQQQQRDRIVATGAADHIQSMPNSVPSKMEVNLEEHITYILYETILGLKYIHDNGQIHRDIKAGNILLDSAGNVRIADFGVSGWLVHGGSRRENTRTFVGTPCWMAPEVMEQVHGYDYKADIWSLGITAMELAKGYAPYAKFAPMKVLLLTIQEAPPSLETYGDDEDPRKWSKSFRSMIDLCLQKNPLRRPSSEQLLAHKHFKSLGMEGMRETARAKIKEQLCDVVEDAGDCRLGGPNQSFPGNAPVCVISPLEENRPAGTTWVFSDGSQVLSPSATDTDGGGNHDFFDEFERTTQGENFTHQTAPNVTVHAETTAINNNTTLLDQSEKDDMNDFFDEFEKSTGGEHFRR